MAATASAFLAAQGTAEAAQVCAVDNAVCVGNDCGGLACVAARAGPVSVAVPVRCGSGPVGTACTVSPEVSAAGQGASAPWTCHIGQTFATHRRTVPVVGVVPDGLEHLYAIAFCDPPAGPLTPGVLVVYGGDRPGWLCPYVVVEWPYGLAIPCSQVPLHI